MEVCYWALLFMPLVLLHHLLNVFVQLANKRALKKKTTGANTGFALQVFTWQLLLQCVDTQYKPKKSTVVAVPL
jgi:hypothetical protein